MRDIIGIATYVGDKAVHKLGEWLGILIYIIQRIHKPLIIVAAVGYVIYVCCTGLDNWRVGVVGAFLVIPIAYVLLTE